MRTNCHRLPRQELCSEAAQPHHAAPAHAAAFPLRLCQHGPAARRQHWRTAAQLVSSMMELMRHTMTDVLTARHADCICCSERLVTSRWVWSKFPVRFTCKASPPTHLCDVAVWLPLAAAAEAAARSLSVSLLAAAPPPPLPAGAQFNGVGSPRALLHASAPIAWAVWSASNGSAQGQTQTRN